MSEIHTVASCEQKKSLPEADKSGTLPCLGSFPGLNFSVVTSDDWLPILSEQINVKHS